MRHAHKCAQSRPHQPLVPATVKLLNRLEIKHTVGYGSQLTSDRDLRMNLLVPAGALQELSTGDYCCRSLLNIVNHAEPEAFTINSAGVPLPTA